MKMHNRPPLLEEPFVQTLSGKIYLDFFTSFDFKLNMFLWNYFDANEAAGFIAIFASSIMSSGKGIKFDLVEISKIARRW